MASIPPSTSSPNHASGGPSILSERVAPFQSLIRHRMAGLPQLLAKLYASRRGAVASVAEPSIADLIPVDALQGARSVGNYLADCLADQKRILIVSDYDCDGATACAVLSMAFGAVGMNFDYLVPDRQIHGYGLTPAIVDDAFGLPDRPDVIITVDNGISSFEGVDRARSLGIDVVVTDHHLAPSKLPNAKLIVNPNQPGCSFPSKSIAGCGVAWYVARALVDELVARGIDPGFDPVELLSYVALGTVADVVPLDENNRTMVALGLGLIRSGQCAPGVTALAYVSGKNPETLTCADIGFGLGPRINAAGRLAHMGTGIECLTCLDPQVAEALAAQLHVTNEERKEIQESMVVEATNQAIELAQRSDAPTYPDGLGPRSVVVFDPSWHEGVVGIVASRLKEDRYRPSIVLTSAASGDIKGSARSIPGFHIKHALDEIYVNEPGVLLKFGGHAMAAGMTIAAGRLDDFRRAFEAVCARHLTRDLLTKTLVHDGALAAQDFNSETIFQLSQQVWGQGFEEPVFLNELVVHEVKVIGKDKAHLKIIAHLANDPSCKQVEVMAFGRGDLVQEVSAMDRMTCAFKPGLSTFRGQTRLQLVVEALPQDIAPALIAVAPPPQSNRIGSIRPPQKRVLRSVLPLKPPSDPAVSAVSQTHVVDTPNVDASTHTSRPPLTVLKRLRPAC